MARKGRQQRNGGNYSIEIIPAGGAGAHGSVLNAEGRQIEAWAFPGTGEVWVDVGQHRSGTIKEVGADDNEWTVFYI